jgi:hypothetical protein
VIVRSRAGRPYRFAGGLNRSVRLLMVVGETARRKVKARNDVEASLSFHLMTLKFVEAFVCP